MTPVREPGSRPPRWHRGLVLAVFSCYALALILTARHLAHAWWSGWIARVVGMGLVAVGLAPWLHWLRPRVAAWLGVVGRLLLRLCYLIVLAPFALITRLKPVTVTKRDRHRSSRWVARTPLPATLDASRLEY